MAARSPRTSAIRVGNSRLAARLDETITEVVYDYGVSQVAELSITAADPTGILDDASLARLGATVTTDGDPGVWSVGSVDAVYGAGITWTYRCRSALAKNLRTSYRSRVEVRVSPTQWVSRRVRQAKGRIVAQRSAQRVAIAQAGKQDRQSVLDVINGLASELEWDWVEHGNTFYFGDAYWALTGGPNLPTWPVTWKSNPASDALALSVNLSDDDIESAGSMDVSLPSEYGRRLRPWHRIQLAGAGRYSGLWLVNQVTFSDDGVSAVDVSCSLPRKPAKKGGST